MKCFSILPNTSLWQSNEAENEKIQAHSTSIDKRFRQEKAERTAKEKARQQQKKQVEQERWHELQHQAEGDRIAQIRVSFAAKDSPPFTLLHLLRSIIHLLARFSGLLTDILEYDVVPSLAVRSLPDLRRSYSSEILHFIALWGSHRLGSMEEVWGYIGWEVLSSRAFLLLCLSSRCSLLIRSQRTCAWWSFRKLADAPSRKFPPWLQRSAL